MTSDKAGTMNPRCHVCFGYGYLVSATFPSTGRTECWHCGGTGRLEPDP